MKYDCIVVGAGATGLIATNILLQAERQVLVLEATSRAGGRIYTARCDGFSRYIELGAEFLHGDVSRTEEIVSQTRTLTLNLESLG